MADVLVHLVDASNPMWRKQVRARAPVSMYICPCEDTPLYIYMRPCEDTPLPSHPNAHPLTHTSEPQRPPDDINRKRRWTRRWRTWAWRTSRASSCTTRSTPSPR